MCNTELNDLRTIRCLRKSEVSIERIKFVTGLEKSTVLPVLDRNLKLRTDLFLGKRLKNWSIKLCFLKMLQYTDWH